MITDLLGGWIMCFFDRTKTVVSKLKRDMCTLCVDVPFWNLLDKAKTKPNSK